MHRGFTLAEALIALGVIGVVAAITLPVFIENYQQKVRTEQNRTVQYKLTQATDQMKSKGKIGPYTSTMAFVNELKKNFKIAQVCDSENLSKCWPTETILDTNGNAVKVADLKRGKDFNTKGYKFENVGIVTADGTPIIMSFKSNCSALDPEKTYMWSTEGNKPVTNATTSCIAMIYDLNGKSKPNKAGEDVRLFNVSQLGAYKIQCKDINGVCIMTTDLSIDPITSFECEAIKDQYGIASCCPFCDSRGNDYWGGAVVACQDAGGRLPTGEELAKIANYIYNTDTCRPDEMGGQCGGATPDENRNKETGNIVPDKDYSFYWTNQETFNNGVNAYHWALGGTQYSGSYYSAWGYRYDSGFRIRCVK